MWYPCHHSRGTTDLSENQSMFALTQYCFKCSIAQYLSYPAKKYTLLFTAYWLINVIAQYKSQIKVNIKLYYLQKYMICYIIWNNSPLLCWRWNKDSGLRTQDRFIQHKITIGNITSGLHYKTILACWTNMDLTYSKTQKCMLGDLY